MKIIKRICSLFLIAALMMPVLVSTASADVGGMWKDEFPTFQKLQKGSTGPYVFALQRYLEGFDEEVRSELCYKNNAGQDVYMDGDFGNRTDSAVRLMQSKLSISSDGYVWGDTWSEIEIDLDRYTDNGIVLKRDLYNPYYIYKIFKNPHDPSGEVIAYYNGSNYAVGVAFAYAF